jgi:OOP family OmpA-OmpF porin
MKKTVLMAMAVCGMVFTGFVATNVQAIEILVEEDFVKKTVVTSQLVKTADNAIFLFDGSDSMSKKYMDTGMSRYDVAKKVFKERNAYFPDLGHNFGLYLYTPWKPVYPVQPYNREKFAAALDSLPAQPRGATMLQGALKKLDSVLKGLSGKTVVYVITDGTYTDVGGTRPGEPQPGKRPGLIAKELAEKYNVCFSVISTADDKKSQAVIDRVASVSSCSIAVPFSKFVERPEYNTGMLYIVKSVVDVQTVTDDTVVGAKVDDVVFGFDSSEVGPQFRRKLNKLGQFLQENPTSHAVIAGYTCNLGGEDYNLVLSKQRAESVAKYLEDNFNIDSYRLVTFWYGKINPIADNNTEHGRRLNRRVEVAVGMTE